MKGTDVIISECSPSDAGRLAEAYNAQVVEIPYDDHPVDPQTLVDALSLSDFYGPGKKPFDFSDSRIFASDNGGDANGFIHVGTIPGDDGSGERRGLIRYLCFPRNRRDVGQALLDSAHEYLSPLASAHHRAFDFLYSCMSAPFLKSPWEHVYALLGSNGYEQVGPGHAVMVLRDYNISQPTLPRDDIDVQVSDVSHFPDHVNYGNLPTVAVRLFRGDEKIGSTEAVPHFLPHWDPELQDTCETLTIGVNEEERGRGFGRYLMERSLYEMQRAGCQHAYLLTGNNNYTAISLYASLGYRTCYRLIEMTRL
jgi:ribosomal protein S18 acetylase RimI-like enzyme